MLHKESCKKCKAAFLKALTKEFGEVTEQWKSGWPCRIDEILSIPQITKATTRSLKKIYKALQDHRGHHDFVGLQKLPRCDYYIKSLNCIVEFDESQHFTSPRALTLSLYPRGIKLGYDRKVWLNRCQELNRHDNDPTWRDETRAWYDTIRDILPVTFGMRPTIRVFSRHLVWCENEENTINTVCKIIEPEKIMASTPKKRSVKPIDFNIVKKNHVEKAIKEIQKDKFPESRKARSTEIVYGDKRFPAKYVLGKAYKIATKTSISPDSYTGGDMSAKVLHNLEFEIFKNNQIWENVKIYRVFLKGTYDNKKGEYNNYNSEQSKNDYAFNKWIKRTYQNKRIKSIFDELDRSYNYTKTPIIIFPACALYFKDENSKKKWSFYCKEKSKKYTIMMGILDKSIKKEYIAYWQKGEYLRIDPAFPKQKLTIGNGWVYLSSNIKNHREKDDPGKYCFDLGHGAYNGRYCNKLKSISKEINISIILTSWYKSTPSFSWIFKNGAPDKNYKIIPFKTEYGDIIDKLKTSYVKNLFE